MKNPEDARTHRRRASTRFGEGPDDASPSLLETLLGHLTDHMARRAMNRVKRGTQEVVRWTILRLILGWVGASILAAGILFTLGAGLKGLEALRCPTWLA